MTPLQWLRRAVAGGDRRRIVCVVAALLLAATFARPGIMLDRPRFEHVVVLDVTQSMNVPDEIVAGRPATRLAHAKYALHEAIAALPCGSKLGWAIFTEFNLSSVVYEAGLLSKTTMTNW